MTSAIVLLGRALHGFRFHCDLYSQMPTSDADDLETLAVHAAGEGGANR